MRPATLLRFALLATLSFVARLAPAQTASCYDALQNGPESDVDCGGDCVPCDIGFRCAVARDCASGRCVRGECQEHAWKSGESVPSGYRLETSSGDAAASARRAGILFFGLSYGGAYIGALVLPQRLSWLYAPIVGPWAALQEDELGGWLRALLVTDGALQAAGAALLLGGIAGRGQQLVRGEMARASPPRVTLVPRATLSRSQLGVGFTGSF
jgi:hypothetical protein